MESASSLSPPTKFPSPKPAACLPISSTSSISSSPSAPCARQHRTSFTPAKVATTAASSLSATQPPSFQRACCFKCCAPAAQHAHCHATHRSSTPSPQSSYEPCGQSTAIASTTKPYHATHRSSTPSPRSSCDPCGQSTAIASTTKPSHATHRSSTPSPQSSCDPCGQSTAITSTTKPLLHRQHDTCTSPSACLATGTCATSYAAGRHATSATAATQRDGGSFSARFPTPSTACPCPCPTTAKSQFPAPPRRCLLSAPRLQNPVRHRSLGKRTLRGGAVEEVLQLGVFSDPGAYAMDLMDGEVAVQVSGLEAIDTDAPTLSGDQGFAIRYTARDISGNVATASRRVVVRPRCETGDRVCEAALWVCMTGLGCQLDLLDSNAANLPAGQPGYPDSPQVPIIKLQGECSPPACEDGTVASLGFPVQVYHLVVHDQFSDPGASARDAAGRDISKQIETAYHPRQWSTAAPTLPGQPFIVKYSVASAVAVRLLFVECPSDERLCSSGTADPHCSQADVCGIERLPESIDTLLQESSAVGTPNSQLRVDLVGEDRVLLESGTPFPRCSGATPPGVTCDRGAALVDQGDDNRMLSSKLDVEVLCPYHDRVAPSTQPCDFDINRPDVYQLHYIVTPLALGPDAAMPIGAAHSVYVKCGDDEDATASFGSEKSDARAACDAGAAALGGDGMDLTSAVLALPASFEPRECAMRSCAANLFAVNGLQGARVNTSALVGTEIVVQFAVVDHQGRVASTNRTLVIVEPEPPCPHASRPYACVAMDSDSPDCSPVPCALRVALLRADEQLPPARLELSSPLGYSDPADIVVQYGELLGWSLTPCRPSSSQSSSGCGAIVIGDSADLYAIEVEEVLQLDCVGAHSSRGDGCNACPVELAGAPGGPHCLPGRYQYRYNLIRSPPGPSASGEEDDAPEMPQTLVRNLTVEWRATVEMDLVLQLAAGSDELVEGIAAMGDSPTIDALRGALAEWAAAEAGAPIAAVRVRLAAPPGGVVTAGATALRLAVTVELVSSHHADLLPVGDGLEAAAERQAARLLELAGDQPGRELSLLSSLQQNSSTRVDLLAGIQGVRLWMEEGPTSIPLRWRDGRYAWLIAEIGRQAAVMRDLEARVMGLAISLASMRLGNSELGRLAQQAIVDDVMAGYIGQASALSDLGPSLVEAAVDLLPPDRIEAFQNEFQTALAMSALSEASFGFVDAQSAAHLSLQSLIGGAAASNGDGSIDGQDCPSGSASIGPERRYAIQFTVEASATTPPTADESAAAAPPGSRRLLQLQERARASDLFAPTARNSTTQSGLKMWYGYHVTPGRRERAAQASTSSVRARRVGATRGSAALFGGVLMHMLRRERPNLDCGKVAPDEQPGGAVFSRILGARYDRLSQGCSAYLRAEAVSQDRGSWGQEDARQHQEAYAAEADPLHPYGRDAVFVPSSPIYNKRLQLVGRGGYYNTSAYESAASDVNAYGEPFGWRHVALPGFRDGFPLVVQPSVGEARLAELRQSVEAGNYWDDQRSEELAVEALSYSLEMSVFAYVQMIFTLNLDGSIRFRTTHFQAIPDTGAAALPVQFLLSIAVTAALAVVLLWQALPWSLCWKALKPRKRRLRLHGLVTDFFDHEDIQHAIRRNRIASISVSRAVPLDTLSEHSSARSMSEAAGSRDDILPFTDSIASFHEKTDEASKTDETQDNGTYESKPPAARLLPGLLALGAVLAAAASLGAAVLLMGSSLSPRASYQVYDAQAYAPARVFLPRKDDAEVPGEVDLCPGCPDRWRLQSDLSGLQGMASDLTQMRALEGMYDAFHFVTGVGLIASIWLLLQRWSWQPRIGIILRTLSSAVGDLISLALIALGAILMLAALGHVLLGDIYQPFATFDGALYDLLFVCLTGGKMSDIHSAMTTPGREQLWVLALLQRLLYLLLYILLVLMIQSFIFALLVWQSPGSQMLSGKAPTILGQLKLVAMDGIATAAGRRRHLRRVLGRRRRRRTLSDQRSAHLEALSTACASIADLSRRLQAASRSSSINPRSSWDAPRNITASSRVASISAALVHARRSSLARSFAIPPSLGGLSQAASKKSASSPAASQRHTGPAVGGSLAGRMGSGADQLSLRSDIRRRSEPGPSWSAPLQLNGGTAPGDMVTPLSGQDGGGDGADPQLMRWESASRSTHLRQAGASSLGEPPWMTPSHRGTLLLRRISNALWLRTPDARDPARRSGEQLPARQWDGDEALVGRAATILARRLGEEGERLVKEQQQNGRSPLAAMLDTVAEHLELATAQAEALAAQCEEVAALSAALGPLIAAASMGRQRSGATRTLEKTPTWAVPVTPGGIGVLSLPSSRAASRAASRVGTAEPPQVLVVGHSDAAEGHAERQQDSHDNADNRLHRFQQLSLQRPAGSNLGQPVTPAWRPTTAPTAGGAAGESLPGSTGGGHHHGQVLGSRRRTASTKPAMAALGWVGEEEELD
eukprot:jgi/Tetstr1/458043/TSEL_044551.t1